MADIEKYIPLESIVQSKPRQVSLEPRELFMGSGSHDYQSSMNELEAELFKQKQSGEFIVFHPSVLGMAPIYNAPNDRNYPNNLCIGFIKSSSLNLPTLTIPDAAVMNGLRFMLQPEEYQKLTEFYEEMKKASGTSSFNSLRLSSFNPMRLSRDVIPNRPNLIFTNDFKESLDVYHNGVRVREGESGKLDSGDVMRIGPSILFGYFRKE